jgi:N-acetylneuraminic acid mutarotase
MQTVLMTNTRRTRSALLQCFTIMLMGLPMPTDAAETWSRLSPLTFPSGNFALGEVRGKIMTAGGITWRDDQKIWLDAIHIYDPRENAWSRIGSLPQGNAYPAFCEHDHSLVLLGGSDGKSMHELMVRITAEGGITTRSLPLHRVYAGNVVIGDDLYVIAGAGDTSNLSTMTSECQKVNLLSARITALPEYPGGAVMLPACAVVGQRIYAFGGAHSETSATVTNTAESHVYDATENSWKTIRPLPVAVRGHAACALDESHILVAGGYTDKFSDRAWLYDVSGNQYREIAPVPYPAGASLLRAGEYVYWIGGEDRMRHRSDQMYRARLRELLEDRKE